FADRKVLRASGMSALAILFGTELGIFQRILGTVSLTGKQWIACILVAFSIVVASELWKLYLRSRQPKTEEKEVAGAVALGPTTRGRMHWESVASSRKTSKATTRPLSRRRRDRWARGFAPWSARASSCQSSTCRREDVSTSSRTARHRAVSSCSTRRRFESRT